MRLSELFSAETILLGVELSEKEELLERIVKYFDSKSMIKDYELALRDVIERERVMSTGIGNGVAIPHAYSDGVDQLVAGFFRTDGEIDFAALDGMGGGPLLHHSRTKSQQEKPHQSPRQDLSSSQSRGVSQKPA